MAEASKTFTIKINDRTVRAIAGQTILEVAEANDIFIPGLCRHPDFPIKGNCRLCLVEVTGRRKLATACQVKAEAGMEIRTDTDSVKKVRNINIELIFAEHIEKCPTCVWRYECPLLRYAREFKVQITRFRDRKNERKIHKFANAVEIDGTQCIDCRNCVDACSRLQNINYLALTGKGSEQEIIPASDKKKQCILCGQCAVHCPVSSAQEQMQWEMVEKELKHKNKILVAQFAPSIRVSIGEDFGLPYGKIVTGQLVSALRSLGFKYVFDVDFAADLTTIVEAEELLDRIKNKGKLPMFTSCCPGWINYLEIYHPELIPYITTSRSPQIHGGGAIKTYWARQMRFDPKQIVVVSIMPCTAKKYEASRPEMKINGMLPVDYVLTTREFTFMIKKNNLDLGKLPESKADDPLGEYTGGGAIFGATGGVMESALRTAQYILNTAQTSECGEKDKMACATRIDFSDVRGLAGVKKATVEIGGQKLKVAVSNGIGNVEELIKRINEFHYIEVMACPGGCIGGGGQPIPTTQVIREKRMQALYELDRGLPKRISAENAGAQKILNWLKENKKIEHQVLHTKYKKRRKY